MALQRPLSTALACHNCQRWILRSFISAVGGQSAVQTGQTTIPQRPFSIAHRRRNEARERIQQADEHPLNEINEECRRIIPRNYNSLHLPILLPTTTNPSPLVPPTPTPRPATHQPSPLAPATPHPPTPRPPNPLPPPHPPLPRTRHKRPNNPRPPHPRPTPSPRRQPPHAPRNRPQRKTSPHNLRPPLPLAALYPPPTPPRGWFARPQRAEVET